jgi:uncharacterized protein YqeY
MINVPEMIKKAMKKELFPGKEELNQAARIILGEMKTKFIDIREEITTEIQYKMLQKMKKDRENSIKIYSEAFEKTHSEVAKNNLEKAKIELEPIDLFLFELEKEMPKKMSEEEIKSFVKDLIDKFDGNPVKGMIMKLISTHNKTYNDIDMSIAAKIVNELVK